ncbi:MAG: hypothetical protein HY207_00120 [Nitrospirae bacterium]|nr:hypothetical protein [Nitrospirota bacterium]
MGARGVTEQVRPSPSVPAIGTSLGIGALWGLANFGVVLASGQPEMEGGLATNLVAFTVGGALMGLTVALILALVGPADRRRRMAWSLGATCAVWGLFVLGGAILGTASPDRYHLVWAEVLRGGAMVAGLGVLLGLVRRG